MKRTITLLTFFLAVFEPFGSNRRHGAEDDVDEADGHLVPQLWHMGMDVHEGHH